MMPLASLAQGAETKKEIDKGERPRETHAKTHIESARDKMSVSIHRKVVYVLWCMYYVAQKGERGVWRRERREGQQGGERRENKERRMREEDSL